MALNKDDPRSVGGYRLLDRLGAGGMGAVYRGRSRSGREVAVKVVHAQYAEDAVFRTRFRQEIAAARRVSGAFTAPVVDADPEAARPWMATQYVPGPSLAASIRDRGPLRGAELRGLALGLVEALREIHRAGVVHRDLKPANVLMAGDGPRVIDFGISRAAENHTLTETGQMIGTPPFMSPEQFTDARSVGPASDVFSLGALLAYAVTGRGPFDADSPYVTAFRVVNEEPDLEAVPAALREVVRRCLAKDPAHRPGLDELAGELARALPEPAPGDAPTVTLRDPAPAGEPAAPDAPAARAEARPGRRRRARALLAAATAAALALGLTAYLVLGPDQDGDDRRGRTASPSGAARWASPPEGWRPWQTTLHASAARGVVKARGFGLDGSGAAAQCVPSRGAVYCGGDAALPVRLDASTGATEWRADLVPPGTAAGGYDSAVLGVRDGVVLVRQTRYDEDMNVEDAGVVGLDEATGRKVWTRAAGGDHVEASFSSGLVLVPGRGRSLTAVSPRTGAERWTVELPAGQFCSFPETEQGLYVECMPDEEDADESLLLVLDPADGSVRRLRVPIASGVFGTVDGRPLLLTADEAESGDVFTEILLIDPETGARERIEPAGGGLRGAGTLREGTLWFTTPDGAVTAVSPRTGTVRWRTRTTLEQPGPAAPDPRTHTLYLASPAGRVAALDTRRGTLLWETHPRSEGAGLGGVTVSAVLPHEGTLVVTTPDGTVFGMDPGHPDREPVPG
ncbi:PQQ-binding-like beta-propeller repeat protein [Streptomyces leeuwenhoekii]|uniref:protein kinase domain-containing protein n=1 Tax=Streptomyces leeuwenhoekii TaxID=1437453 RepID=UPI0036F50F60